MKRPQAKCRAITAWLSGNLGKRCLAPLSHTDWYALEAVVHIVRLYSIKEDPDVAKAFGYVVRQMQPQTREFAYHAIAEGTDWYFRPILWERAGLDPIPVRRCKCEPPPYRSPVCPPVAQNAPQETS